MEKKLLEIVYQKYHREIYLYLYSFCRNHHLTEDLLQETFLKAILSLPNTHSNIRAWLYMVARNLYLNYRKKNEKNQLLEDVDSLSDTACENDVFDGIFKDEKRRLLYSLIQELEDRTKEVIIMQYFGEMSQKEIAAVLRVTPENVRVLSYRGKKRLKERLEESGYEV